MDTSAFLVYEVMYEKTANQIREEVCKQLATKYKQAVEHWKDVNA